MRFEPVHYKDKLTIINPAACMGVVTLWSDVNFVLKKLGEAGADLTPDRSKVAVMGYLHGDGFKYLLRNLLYNPQIDTLLVIGNDRSGSLKYLVNFFEGGVEPLGRRINYMPTTDGVVVESVRITGTDYVMDSLVSPGMFAPPPAIKRISGIGPESFREAAAFIEGYAPAGRTGERLSIEVPEVEIENFPSNVRAHTIVEDTPSAAWKYLVHRVFRFGREVLIKKGRRRELQNVKVVIEKPAFEDDDVIRGCGFDPEAFRKYQEDILSPDISPDEVYTYGNRIRAYFGVDCLDNAAAGIKDGPDGRNCYITTWDNTRDLTGGDRPCLVSLFFRKTDGVLHLTASFRTHNTSNAWLENVYGLMAVQRYVCGRAGLDAGAITVFSHSISLNPKYLDKVKLVHDEVSSINLERRDPNGYFLITTDGDEIVLRLVSDSVEYGEYRGRTPLSVQHMLYRDCAVSDTGHAMYVGRQLQRAYQCIQDGSVYIQE